MLWVENVILEVKEYFAVNHGVSEITIQNYCSFSNVENSAKERESNIF